MEAQIYDSVTAVCHIVDLADQHCDAVYACRDFDEKKPNAFTLLGKQL